jgi:hypothetical protein
MKPYLKLKHKGLKTLLTWRRAHAESPVPQKEKKKDFVLDPVKGKVLALE